MEAHNSRICPKGHYFHILILICRPGINPPFIAGLFRREIIF